MAAAPDTLLDSARHHEALRRHHRVARVDLTVAEGEFVGLIGPNGAGKTTFFNCLLGMLRPECGSVLLRRRGHQPPPRVQASAAGFRRTFQRHRAVRRHVGADHFLWPSGSPGRRPPLEGPADRGEADGRGARTVPTRCSSCSRLHDRRPTSPSSRLSLGRGRLVELGRALMTEPKLLLLDEPSSGLDVRETAALAGRLRGVQEEQASRCCSWSTTSRWSRAS